MENTNWSLTIYIYYDTQLIYCKAGLISERSRGIFKIEYIDKIAYDLNEMNPTSTATYTAVHEITSPFKLVA